MSLQLQVNGKTVQSHSDADTPLLWVLRDELGMTGTKFGCGSGLCGACTVHLTVTLSVHAKPKSAPLLAKKSAPLKAWEQLAPTRCKKLGSSTKFPSAAIANLVSS